MVVGFEVGLLLCESLVEQPDDDGEVLALVVGREEDRVLVLDRHRAYGITRGMDGLIGQGVVEVLDWRAKE